MGSYSCSMNISFSTSHAMSRVPRYCISTVLHLFLCVHYCRSTSLVSSGHSTSVAPPTEFNLKSLMNLLGKAAYLWNQIGIQLKINSGRLKSIKNEYNNDMDRLATTLDVWLANEALPCNYETIYDILRSPSVNRSDLIPLEFR